MKVEGKEAPNPPPPPPGPVYPGASSLVTFTPLRSRRLSYGPFPEPLKGDVPYANSRPELAGLSLGEQVRIVMSTAAWNEVMSPTLEALDAERPKKGPGPPTARRSWRAACSSSASPARAPTPKPACSSLARAPRTSEHSLASANPPRPRREEPAPREVFDSVPSAATVWRHKQRFGLERHARAYEELFERLAEEPFEEFPSWLMRRGSSIGMGPC